MTSIHKIVKSGNLAEVKKAISSNNINLKDKDGQTPLHIASYDGKVNIVKALLSKKADINAVDLNGWTPLHCACSKPNFPVCEVLLQSKHIDVTKQNNDSTTALAYLVRQPLEKVQKDLETYLRCLQLMKITKEIVNAVNRFGEPLLHAACTRGNIYSVHFLLQNGADVNQPNAKQETALHWAVKSNKVATVRALMCFGADPFLPSNEGISAMEMAIKNNDKEIISLLTKRALLCSEVKKECTKYGWIEVNILKEWTKFFFVLQEVSIFGYETDDGNCKPSFFFDILEVDVLEGPQDKETKDHPFTFSLKGEYRNSLFSSKTELDKEDWIKCIDQAKKIHINTINANTDEQGGGVSIPESPPEESIPRLLRLLEHPDNLACADCNSYSPYWISIKFGILICQDCALVHHKLGTSPDGLKSIHFDSLNLNDFMVLKCNGNVKSNLKFESNIPTNVWKPTPRSPLIEKESFIRSKYLSKAFVSQNDSPQKTDLRKVFASRIASFETNYAKEILTDNLSIQSSLWNHLKKTSTIYQKFIFTVDNDKNDAIFVEFLKEKLGKSVLGLSSQFLRYFLVLIRLYKISSEKENVYAIKNSIFTLLNKYDQLQRIFFDEHYEIILKWWLPQALEVIALLQLSSGEFNLSPIMNTFISNSYDAYYAFIGEYLHDHAFISKLSDESYNIANSFASIKSKSKTHTDLLRKLLTTTLKYNSSFQENTDSFSEVYIPKRAKVDFDIDLKRTSSATSQSSTENSPRDMQSEDIGNNSSFHPLLNILDDFHPAMKATLTSVIMESVSNELQISLLGVIDTGTSLIEASMAKNLFTQHRNFLYSSPSQSLTLSRERLEKLHAEWPYLSDDSIYLSNDRNISLLLRFILIINRDILYVFSRNVYWFIPEVWDSWESIKEILTEGILYLGVCSIKGKDRNSSVLEAISLLITQVRWTISKLIEIQELEERSTI